MSNLQKNIAFFNGARALLSPSFQETVPVASQENFEAIGTMLLNPSYGNVFNEWLTTILNRIGMVVIRQPKARNKLSRFWTGTMEWGDLIEEIGIDLPKAQRYLDGLQDGDASNNYQGDINKVPACEPNPFCTVPQDNVTHFHRRNREEFYKKTIFRHTLMKAFTGQSGFGTIIEAIIQSMYTANRRDQYLWAKECFSQYVNAPRMPLKPEQLITLDPIIDQPSANAYLEKIKIYVDLLTFNSVNFNPVGQTQFHDLNELILLQKTGFGAILDTESLQGAFNPERLETNFREIITLDDFGTNTWTGAIPADQDYRTTPGEGIVAMIIPAWFLNVVNNSTEFASLYNPEKRNWNYWLHIWETYWVSYFAPAIIFRQ